MLKNQIPSRPRDAEGKTVQVRVLPKRVVEGYAGGTIYWTTPARAKLLVDQKGVEVVGDVERPWGTVGPTEAKPTGPSEIKSSSAPATSADQGSAASDVAGQESQPSALAAGQASTPDNADTSAPPAPLGDAGLSPLTTRTKLRRSRT